MKKINYLVVIATMSIMSYAQPYGINFYTHAGSYLSSGTVTSSNGNDGFLQAGYRPAQPVVGNPNFYIDRTDGGGTFAAPYTFSSEYTIQGLNNCGGLITSTNCAGVVAIEENNPGATDYAIAGSYSEGVFFSMLNAIGAPYSQVLFPFPVNSTQPSKPILVPSSVPNEYFICGSYMQPSIPAASRMYIIKVNNAGGILGSQIYHIANGIVFFPKDMLVSPYNPNELVVVGAAVDNLGGAGFTSLGFFSRFDATTLVNTSCNLWGQAIPNVGISDGFDCITVSNNSGGYVVGGYSNLNPLVTLWTLDVDPTGTFSNWNFIQDLNIGGPRAVVDVVERYSNYHGIYTYYCLVDVTAPVSYLTTFKLDNTGNPFTLTNPPGASNNNEYLVSSPLGNNMTGVNISFLDNGGPTDQGYHVHAIDNSIAGGDHALVEAAFNGEDGCLSTLLTNMVGNQSGPNNTFTVGVVILPGLNPCSTFNLVQNSPVPIWNNLCGSAALPAAGSLAKGGAATGLVNSKSEENGIKVYPNPVNSELQISFYNENNEKAEIKLYNYLGQEVKDLSGLASVNGSEQSIKFNLSSTDLSSGIYFLKVSVNGSEYKEKLIYTKQ